MMRRQSAVMPIVTLLAALVLSPHPAAAQTVVKIGMINSYTGFVAQAGDLGAKGHRPLRQAAREGSAAGRQDRADQARRHLQPRGRQAAGAGTDRARPCPAVDRHRAVAGRGGGRAADRGGEGAAAARSSPRPASRSRASRPMSRGSPSRCGRSAIRSANGRWSKAGRPPIPRSPTSSPATIRGTPSPRASPMAAARSSAR